MIRPAAESEALASLENHSGLDPQELRDYLDYLASKLEAHRDGRKPAVYFSPSIEWLGHVCQDAHIIKTLYDVKDHQIFFVSHKPRREINPYVSAVALRDFVPTFVEERHREWNIAVSKALLKGGLEVSYRGYVFLFGYHASALKEHYQRHLLAHGRAATYRLTPEEVDLRTSILRNCGVEPGDKIAVIHVRSSGYWAGRFVTGSDTTNEFRNARIENYVPAIEYLRRKGYFVVRVGDNSMPPAPVSGPRFLDAPYSPDYELFADVAFASCCEVFIHCCSGPLDLARGFGSRLFGINPILSHFWPTEPDEVFLPKKHRLTHNGEYLSIPEVINLDLCSVTNTQVLSQVGVEMVENTPEEILGAVEEYVERETLDTILSSAAATGFRSVAKAEHDMRTARHDPAPERRSFVMWYPTIAMSAVTLDSNPSLLSGDLLPFEDRPWRLG
jgi:putative glycosyltransferase (TIGR04372 family)